LLARARAVTLLNYPELARCFRVDPFAMLASAGLRPSDLDDCENWLPGEKILSVLDETAERAQRDDFGVLLGEFRSFASLGPVSLLLKHESTLRDVIDSIIVHRRLINELIHLRLDDDGEVCRLSWGLVPGLQSSEGVNLLATIAYRILVRSTAIAWQPECIHFRHRPPQHSAAFTRVFDCALEFDSEFDGMSFASKSLASTNAYADPELAAHARRLLSLIPDSGRPESVTDRVKGMVPLLIPTGQADAGNVARCLGISVRTLQRLLKSEGETFSGLVNACRRELSVRYLTRSNHSITDISELTGYSTPGAYSRWFVCEFGMSPGKWRTGNLPRESEYEFAARAVGF